MRSFAAIRAPEGVVGSDCLFHDSGMDEAVISHFTPGKRKAKKLAAACFRSYLGVGLENGNASHGILRISIVVSGAE